MFSLYNYERNSQPTERAGEVYLTQNNLSKFKQDYEKHTENTKQKSLNISLNYEFGKAKIGIFQIQCSMKD